MRVIWGWHWQLRRNGYLQQEKVKCFFFFFFFFERKKKKEIGRERAGEMKRMSVKKGTLYSYKMIKLATPDVL